jgi:hypothetical protein
LKFPVPFSREFSEKDQWWRELSDRLEAQKRPKTRKFPVFSLMIREFHAESSSQQTATSAKQAQTTVPYGDS